MPSSKGHRRNYEEKNKRGRLAEKASSFHGRSSETAREMLHRPRTVPDLLSGKGVVTTTSPAAGGGPAWELRPKLTKLLLKVTIQRSLGAVQVLTSPESTVEDLIAAAMQQYVKEGRRPILHSTDPSGFDLHYSQFSLESLSREEKLMALGSRNFFLCPKRRTSTEIGGSSGTDGVATSATSCSKEVDKATKIALRRLKFMDFLL